MANGKSGYISVAEVRGRLDPVPSGSELRLNLDASTSRSSRLRRPMPATSWSLAKAAFLAFRRRGTSLSLFLAVAVSYGLTVQSLCSIAPTSPKDFVDISTMQPGAMRCAPGDMPGTPLTCLCLGCDLELTLGSLSQRLRSLYTPDGRQGHTVYRGQGYTRKAQFGFRTLPSPKQRGDTV